MANDVELSSLIIEVDAESKEASKGIDAVASALSHLNANSKLTRVINSLTKLSTSLKVLSGATSATSSLERVVNALNRLSAVQKPAGLTNALNALQKFPGVVAGLNPAKLTAFSAAMGPLSNALSQLSDVQKLSGLNSAFNTLQKLPKVTESLDSTDLEKFAEQLQKVRAAVQPLAADMQKVSAGFAALPKNVQKAINANQRVAASNKSTATSFKTLASSMAFSAAKFTIFGIALQRIADYLGDSIVNFNAYVENVNLFSVSMGEFTPKAAEFTQALQDILGVDASEAMRNMGITQNLTTSFGVAADQAYILSKNITQLGYDFASFFNISTEEAFAKLQAAISGELEPIRRLGVDISEARLQQELFALGINTSVESLSQADKSLLRYIAIMKQTGNAQTDMARTLNSPANAVRVLQAQVDLLSRSLGSIFIPALNAVLPYLTALAMLAREALTALGAMVGVNVEFADLGSTGTVSTGDVSAGLDDVAGSAAAAAKEISYLIGGFDELNVLSSSGGSGGGGAGSSVSSSLGDVTLPEYDIFDGAVASKAKEQADSLKKLGQDIMKYLKPALPVIEGLAAGFVGMFVTKKVIDFVNALKNIGKTSSLFKKLVDIIGDFNFYFENGYGVVDSAKRAIDRFRDSLSSTTKIMLGVGGFIATFVTAYTAIKNLRTGAQDAATSIGQILIVATIVGTGLYVALGPVGLVITLVGTLAGAFMGARDAAKEMGQKIYESSEAFPVLTQIAEENAEIVERCETNMNNLNGKLDHLAALDAEWTPVRNLVEEIYDLSEKTNKSAYETELFQTKVDYLNSLGLGDLKLEFDETKTHVTNTKDEVLKLVDSMELQARTAALQEIVTEAYKTQYQAAQDVLTASQNVDAAQQVNGESVSALRKYYQELSTEGWTWIALGLDEKYEALSIQVDESKKALEDSQNAYDTAKQTLEDSTTAVDKYTEELVNLQNSMGDTGEVAQNFSSVVDEALDLTGLSDKLKTEGQEMGGGLTQGFADGLYGSIGTVENGVLKLSDDTISALHDGPLKFGSPSRTARTYGMWFVQGLSEGIKSESPNLDAVITILTTSIQTKLTSVNQSFTSMTNSILATLNGSFRVQWTAGWNVLTTNTKTAVNTMKSHFSSGMSSIVVTFKDGLNTIIDYTNTFIRKFNRSMKLDSYGIEIDGKVVVPPFTLDLGSLATIPKLAKGGVLTSPSLVMAGEYANASTNPEIVSPRSLMYDTVVEANEVLVIAIVAAIRELQRAVEEKDSELVFSPTDVGKAAAAYAQQQKRRTGKNPFD